jgi:polyhydroxybutyrate depolymerase
MTPFDPFGRCLYQRRLACRVRRGAFCLVLASALVLAACGTSSPSTTDPAVPPVEVFVPSSYDGSVAIPLVVLLHGYTTSGDMAESYLELQPLAEERGFLYAHPDGSKDRMGQRFWNATDACCDVFSAKVDDSAHLMALIDNAQKTYNVDAKRIYVVGHSNGGFMAYRMACDHADRIAAVVSVAGATFADTKQCTPSGPVNVLQIHGTADEVIDYQGGQIDGHAYPGATATAATWASYNGCRPTPEMSGTPVDLEAKIAGAETSVSLFADCPTGGAVELWTVNGGSHVPTISSTFSSRIIDFLYAHPKP